jgi:hypothetical protein
MRVLQQASFWHVFRWSTSRCVCRSICTSSRPDICHRATMATRFEDSSGGRIRFREWQIVRLSNSRTRAFFFVGNRDGVVKGVLSGEFNVTIDLQISHQDAGQEHGSDWADICWRCILARGGAPSERELGGEGGALSGGAAQGSRREQESRVRSAEGPKHSSVRSPAYL